ncbi:hypothetical protein M2350_002525 [Candidatus Fervidibacter sacchari]|uniref:Uncharacterized protein n=1 Tax=Candidatus Fervidibacter sacchari TaxID=1448929 RepID=A0ABT2EQ73_9BACT|nr:hypothetical protein [Candidatus Fervidibacter sacchari]
MASSEWRIVFWRAVLQHCHSKTRYSGGQRSCAAV